MRSSHFRFPLIICRIRRLPELFETHLHLRLVNQTGINFQHSKIKISRESQNTQSTSTCDELFAGEPEVKMSLGGYIAPVPLSATRNDVRLIHRKR